MRQIACDTTRGAVPSKKIATLMGDTPTRVRDTRTRSKSTKRKCDPSRGRGGSESAKHAREANPQNGNATPRITSAEDVGCRPRAVRAWAFHPASASFFLVCPRRGLAQPKEQVLPTRACLGVQESTCAKEKHWFVPRRSGGAHSLNKKPSWHVPFSTSL